MMWRICETCVHSAWRDGKTAVTEVCLICTFGKDGQPTNWKEKTMTNADRIRAMSDEDMAVWIAGMTTVCECCAELNECEAPKGFNRCSHGVEDWLKQPAEEEL